jgi:hypothetical protein
MTTIAQTARKLVPLYRRKLDLLAELSDLNLEIEALESTPLPSARDGEYSLLIDGEVYLVAIDERAICSVEALEPLEETHE